MDLIYFTFCRWAVLVTRRKRVQVWEKGGGFYYRSYTLNVLYNCADCVSFAFGEFRARSHFRMNNLFGIILVCFLSSECRNGINQYSLYERSHENNCEIIFIVWTQYAALSATAPTHLIPLPFTSNGRGTLRFAPTTLIDSLPGILFWLVSDRHWF
jgi:hypothetical protein